MATILVAAGPHPLLPSHFSWSQKAQWCEILMERCDGAKSTLRRPEAEPPRCGGHGQLAHTLQHRPPHGRHLSCHCKTPTLNCLCQRRPCALSFAVLFMGTHEVARRVAESGRFFFHCNTAACTVCCSESTQTQIDWVCLHNLGGGGGGKCVFSKVLNFNEMHMCGCDAGPWSCSLQAVRITNSCTESRQAPQGPAGNSPPLLPWPLRRTLLRTDGASSPSTSPSSPGAKLSTWLPWAAPPMAMQACTPPCPHSARPPWISTNYTCPARLPAKYPMRERTRKTRWRRPRCANKVNWPPWSSGGWRGSAQTLSESLADIFKENSNICLWTMSIHCHSPHVMAFLLFIKVPVRQCGCEIDLSKSGSPC